MSGLSLSGASRYPPVTLQSVAPRAAETAILNGQGKKLLCDFGAPFDARAMAPGGWCEAECSIYSTHYAPGSGTNGNIVYVDAYLLPSLIVVGPDTDFSLLSAYLINEEYSLNWAPGVESAGYKVVVLDVKIRLQSLGAGVVRARVEMMRVPPEHVNLVTGVVLRAEASWGGASRLVLSGFWGEDEPDGSVRFDGGIVRQGWASLKED